MAPIRLKTVMANRLLVLGVFTAGTGLLFGSPVLGQVSPEEHEKRHGPGAPAKPGPGPGMAGHEGHGHGGKAAAKELFPSLMDLPDLSPKRRAEVERQAHERMKAGAALMSRGLGRLSQ